MQDTGFLKISAGLAPSFQLSGAVIKAINSRDSGAMNEMKFGQYLRIE